MTDPAKLHMSKTCTKHILPIACVILMIVTIILSACSSVSDEHATQGSSGDTNDIAQLNVQNPVVSAFLATPAYNSSNYTTSFMEPLINTTASTLDDPAELPLNISGTGTLYIRDETTGTTTSMDYTPGACIIRNLTPQHTYEYWTSGSDGNMAARGRIKALGTLRMIYMEQVRNVRDLGGWSCDGGNIRYGLMFRGSQINGNGGLTASAGNIARFRNLGIADEIDFRTTTERLLTDDNPTNDIVSSDIGNNVTYSHYEVIPYASGLTPGSVSNQLYASAITQIMNDVIAGKPAYYHCAIGADRTGTFACLLEGLLGVSQSDIDKDYELTSLFSGYNRLRTNSDWQSLITYIRSFGKPTFRDNVVAWAMQAGISIDTINDFRAAAIDGDPETLTP